MNKGNRTTGSSGKGNRNTQKRFKKTDNAPSGSKYGNRINRTKTNNSKNSDNSESGDYERPTRKFTNKTGNFSAKSNFKTTRKSESNSDNSQGSKNKDFSTRKKSYSNKTDENPAPYRKRSESDFDKRPDRKIIKRRSSEDSNTSYHKKSDSFDKDATSSRPKTFKRDNNAGAKRVIRKNTDNFNKTENKAENTEVNSETGKRYNQIRKRTSESNESRPKKNFGERKPFGAYKDNKSSRNKKQATAREDDGLVRLNKYIANSGICSRREADEFIKAGLVSVNGVIITELGVKVSLTDAIKFNNENIKPEHKVYLLLNKPKDYITTVKDSYAEHTVMELIEGACKERVYPVGRLDRQTTGVLLFTNDGDMAKKLTHPKNNIEKIYHVYLDKPVTKAHMIAIAEGVELEDGYIKADSINYTSTDDKTMVGIEIHSGRNRIVRRIFEHFDYKVKKLDRVIFAGLSKKGLQRGHHRMLTEKEISFLKMIKGDM